MTVEQEAVHEQAESTAGHEAMLAVLEQTRGELAKARDELQGTVRAMALDRALSEAGAVNVVAARAKLGEAAGQEPAAAVAALRAREPALFAARPRVAAVASTGSARGTEDGAQARVRTAATRAAMGDRRALLEYMRLRRAVG